MNLDRAYRPSVIWRADYDKSRTKWRFGFLLTHLFYLAVVTCLVLFLVHNEKRMKSISSQKKDLEDFKKEEAIYSILKSEGISLNQGLDIADAVIGQSRRLDIPISLILAVMKKESMFNPHAISSRNALGLMQIHPVTWKEYTAKLQLNVSSRAAFDPVTNVVVATHIIKDLYDFYKKTTPSESELWASVLSAYCAGKNSIAQRGFESSHKQYVADINKFKREFDKTFSE